MKLGKHVHLNLRILRDDHLHFAVPSPGQLVMWAWFAKGYGNDSIALN
jgi:hypothetical protein